MSKETSEKSVITCDLEGRIKTFNEGAEQIFGYDRDEVIGHERVSLFSPGLVVLDQVESWLEEAKETGSFETDTVFVRKDGTRFPAHVRITSTHRDGEHIGYCGVTEPLENSSVEEAMPDISPAAHLMKWLVITRAPFLSAVIAPVLIGAGWASYAYQSAISLGMFAAVLFGACALQVAANTFNDYYDWKSGADPNNNEYFQGLSGGSRAVELGLISQQGMFRTAIVASAIAVSAGVYLTLHRGWGIFGFGLFGLFTAYFYTAPPLRLVARKGLGELFVGLNFGPLTVAGTTFALTGHFGIRSIILGVPIGLLTSAILWINEFPDAEADEHAGKEHLVVVLGKSMARWGYAGLLLTAYGVIVAMWAINWLPTTALAALLTVPLSVFAVYTLFEHFDDRQLVAANRSTILIHLATGLLLAGGIYAESIGLYSLLLQ
jgi:1,4-dihydroxy-2-naphthoate octaprenyltransferase